MKSQYVMFAAVCQPPLRKTEDFSAVAQAAGRNIALQAECLVSSDRIHEVMSCVVPCIDSLFSNA